MRASSFLLLLLAGLACSAASAQSYRCSSGNTTYFSDKPCADSARLQGYGPQRSSPSQAQYSAPLPRAPQTGEHVQYLSSSCASISEAIRTAPARGIRGDVIRGLQEEYRQKCALEDQDARARAQQDRNQERQVQLAQRESQAAEKRQARERADRCNGMRDVIVVKRKREADLNDKEREVLRSLETRYNEVCVPVR